MPAAKEPLKIHPDLSAIKPRERMMIVQGYRYHPPVIALREGQDLIVKSEDSKAYNFRWMPDPKFNRGGNLAIQAGNTHVISALRAQPRPMTVGSDHYPWMTGTIGIFDHPYFALTDEDGRFDIPLVPAGSVRVLVWHQSIGWVGGDGRKGSEHTISGGGLRDLGDVKMKN
jgi:hypothetical protein